MEAIVIHPKNKKQSATIEAVLTALDVSFKKELQTPYDPEFVEKIMKSKEQAKNGEVVSYTIDQLENLCK